MNISELESKTHAELQEIAKSLEISGYSKMRKRELIMRILESKSKQEGLEFTQGVLEVLSEGYGFLRRRNYTPSNDDVYISPSQIRRFNLRTGDMVIGQRLLGW